MSVLLVFHSGFGGAVEAAFPLTAVLDISTATAGSWNLFVGFFFFFPASSQINNPPSWRRARVCFETISPHGSLKHARLIKKRGETTRTVQLSSERKCSTSRAREEDGGTLNGSLFQPSNTIVFGATPIPTNHILTFTPPPPAAFLHLFVHSLTLPFPAADTLYGERKDSQYPHPLFLQSAAHSARLTLHVQLPKHSTCHSSLIGCWEPVCVLIFSAPIH